MKVNEYLTVVAMEECAEIQQVLSKALRFGFDDCHPKTPNQSNEEEILTEYYQLTAMIEEMQKHSLIQEFSPEKIAEIKVSKIEKVYHYMTYSKEKGLLEDGE
ncbi:hypothetical protein I6N95_07370 [Vagococcus sp. BWB3-3]|uniref:Uncharacterized protein n=1 Tax=Vagococcus allomyrinae TaxID=2794353 RepID=A0A940P4D8_9ENTE|nr:hypothetical protein [Vagococcus allomyrinae]MBP1040820.1 hypothetical protein [Vagococcus allomyrinae]